MHNDIQQLTLFIAATEKRLQALINFSFGSERSLSEIKRETDRLIELINRRNDAVLKAFAQ